MTTTVRTQTDIEECRFPGIIDRARVDALTDAELRRHMAEDPDTAPEVTREEIRRARHRPPLLRPTVPAE